MIDALKERLWDSSIDGEIYAILDGARDERIEPWLHTTLLEHACLYELHAIADELKPVAPYVVRLRPWSDDTTWLLESGWGHGWGVLCATRAPLDELRQHLRRFLLVRDERGRQLYFRYYDPRVLRIYLSTCTAAETSQVFGPISRIWTEARTGRGFEEYAHASGGDPPARWPLVIRAAQMAAFDDADFERFVADAVERVALYAPRAYAALGRDACESLVRDTERICRRHGILFEEDVLRVITARVESGDAFAEVLALPEVRAVLVEHGLGGHFKAELLEAQLLAAGDERAAVS